MILDYFYGQAGELFSFYRIPKALFQEPRFQSLSTDAKTLYGILLDRMSLSVKNGWLDEQNRVFILFTILDHVRHPGQCDGQSGYGVTTLDAVVESIVCICNELLTWADVYDTANHDERRAILQQFIKEIRVRKDYEISITLNASFNQVEQLKAVSSYDGAEIFEGISEKEA